MTSGPITSWQIEGGNVEAVTDFIFLGSKITVDSDWSHEIKRCLLLGKNGMTNLDSVLKSRDITLPKKVCIVKAMVFPVVIYGCENESHSVVFNCLQSCGGPPASSLHGILQARILEWVAIPFSREYSQPRVPTQVS